MVAGLCRFIRKSTPPARLIRDYYQIHARPWHQLHIFQSGHAVNVNACPGDEDTYECAIRKARVYPDQRRRCVTVTVNEERPQVVGGSRAPLFLSLSSCNRAFQAVTAPIHGGNGALQADDAPFTV